MTQYSANRLQISNTHTPILLFEIVNERATQKQQQQQKSEIKTFEQEEKLEINKKKKIYIYIYIYKIKTILSFLYAI